MTDRELLEKLYGFLRERTFILGDEASIRDMVLRYKQPPVTLLNRVAMQLTVTDYRNLAALLKQIDDHLKTTEETLESA